MSLTVNNQNFDLEEHFLQAHLETPEFCLDCDCLKNEIQDLKGVIKLVAWCGLEDEPAKDCVSDCPLFYDDHDCKCA